MAYTILGHIYPIPLQPWQAHGNKSDKVLSQAVQQSVRVTLKGREKPPVLGQACNFYWMQLHSVSWKGEDTLCSKAFVCPCEAEAVALPVGAEGMKRSEPSMGTSLEFILTHCLPHSPA